MRVQLVAKPGKGMTGTTRYTENLCRGLREAGVEVDLAFPEPFPPWLAARRGLQRMGLDAEAFFRSYPLRVRPASADVVHLTTQTMATLLMRQRFDRPVVVTVLDIIPYLVRRDKELNTLRHPVDALFYRLALLGLRRADALIAISEYTKRTLVEALGLPPERITVVYPAVDHERFRPLTIPDWFWEKYALDRAGRYILFVGSDDPRKNLRALLQALAVARKQGVGATLLKVGAAGNAAERARLRALAAELGLSEHVRWLDTVPDDDLPLFYNAATVFVMPSLYEGFGLPALEAMACGTNVMVAGRGSLPEVVGNECATISQPDEAHLAAGLTTTIHQPPDRACLRSQSQKFSVERQAQSVSLVYHRAQANYENRLV